MAGLVRPGGFAIIGELFWRTGPRPEWPASFGMEPGESLDLAGTIARMTTAELELVTSVESTLFEWDSYEDDYAAAIERWAATNPGDPDRDESLGRAAFFRESWAIGAGPRWASPRSCCDVRAAWRERLRRPAVP